MEQDRCLAVDENDDAAGGTIVFESHGELAR